MYSMLNLEMLEVESEIFYTKSCFNFVFKNQNKIINFA